jgi:hypothetical protein
MKFHRVSFLRVDDAACRSAEVPSAEALLAHSADGHERSSSLAPSQCANLIAPTGLATEIRQRLVLTYDCNTSVLHQIRNVQ